jgi:RNA polymerase sigma factor (sigma-70 family)
MERKSRLQPLARAVLRTQSDDRLVALARDGKEAAFEEIVRRYRPALVAFAAAYGPPDAEDVVQESLVRSWDALRESTGEMHLKAWLYTIVRNRALNARRDSRPHEELTDEVDGVPQPPEIVLTNDELQRAVLAIGALPEPQREALVRSALEGHTHDQIAAAIGSTPGAVRQLIYRARLTVRHGVGAVIPLPLVAALAELGAGGAGAATAYAILTMGAERLELVDTLPARAAALARQLGAQFPGRVFAVAPSRERIASADGLIHATPVGMAAHPGMALPAEWLHPRLWIAEIVYFPLETELLRAARARGCRTLDGAGMAVWQAVEAFRLFTGVQADADRMRRFFDEAGRP